MDRNASSSPPSIPIRWFRPTMSTPFLELPTAPVSVTNVDTWIALSAQESAQCEEAWQALSEEERQAADLSSKPDSSQLGSGSMEELVEEEHTIGVTISEDKLFEVDVKSMEASHFLKFICPN